MKGPKGAPERVERRDKTVFLLLGGSTFLILQRGKESRNQLRRCVLEGGGQEKLRPKLEELKYGKVGDKCARPATWGGP